MDNKAILEEAIQKAIDGGWLTILCSSLVSWKVYDFEGVSRIALTIAGTTTSEHPYQYIFDKNFAKALWGEDSIGHHNFVFFDGTHWEEFDNKINNWQYHLQQMVISPDPIAYLGKNI